MSSHPGLHAGKPKLKYRSMTMQTQTSASMKDRQYQRGASEVPIHDATNLTDGGATAHIQLDDQVYTLRITRAGKLILTK